MFNFGIHLARGWIQKNPTYGIAFLPEEKKLKYVPPKEDVLRVILAAYRDTQDYLWTIMLTMSRMSEINRLTWQDVDLKARFIVLYTRKKKGGNLTPRKVPMPERLYEILHRRYIHRDKQKPWVFWHRYWSRKRGKWLEKPYKDRNSIMKSLCKKQVLSTSASMPLGISAPLCWIMPTFLSVPFSVFSDMKTGPPPKSICILSATQNAMQWTF